MLSYGIALLRAVTLDDVIGGGAVDEMDADCNECVACNASSLEPDPCALTSNDDGSVDLLKFKGSGCIICKALHKLKYRHIAWKDSFIQCSINKPVRSEYDIYSTWAAHMPDRKRTL